MAQGRLDSGAEIRERPSQLTPLRDGRTGSRRDKGDTPRSMGEGGTMRVLDLFSGLGGWSAAFKDRGHSVTTLDIEPKFKPDICADILSIDSISKLGTFDIVLASPPCEVFSIAAAWLHHWKKEDGRYVPNDQRAVLAKSEDNE